MFYTLLLFIFSFRFAICFEYMVHNEIESTIELSRYGLFRKGIHKFSISNFIVKNEWEKVPPRLMFSVERDKSLNLPYPILMDISTEYICLMAPKPRNVLTHPHSVFFQIDFQTQSLVPIDSSNSWAFIDIDSNKTTLAGREIRSGNRTELKITMLSSKNNGSFHFDFQFVLSLADAEKDEGLYKFYLHNCDKVPVSFKVLIELIDFNMIMKYFFTTQLSLNSIIYVIHNIYFYCTYMLYDGYYNIMRFLCVLSIRPYSIPYFIHRKQLPHHSFSYFIFQQASDVNMNVKCPYISCKAFDYWLLAYAAAKVHPLRVSEISRVLFVTLPVWNYISFCTLTTTSELWKEYLEIILIMIILSCWAVFDGLWSYSFRTSDRYTFFKRAKLQLLILVQLTFLLEVAEKYDSVASFDLVLKLMIANDVPFHFAWIQFLIEDGLTMLKLIAYVYTIKHIEYDITISVSEERENKKIDNAEII